MKTGDALARGLRAFPLRECSAIRVIQEVALPASWTQKTAKVEFDILPYDRQVDSVFATCGERSAYGPAPAQPTVAAAAPQKPEATAAAPKPAATSVPVAPAPAATGWQMARVVTHGKTNVRAGPRLESSVVTMLDPGAVVLVQRTATDWWRARQFKGPAFDGYIREDRLNLK